MRAHHRGAVKAGVEKRQCRVVGSPLEFRQAHPVGNRQPAKQRRPLLVELLHAGEIERRLGLGRKNVVEKRFLSPGHGLETGVDQLFIAQARMGHVAKRLAARRAGAMTGPHQKRVGFHHEHAGGGKQRLRRRLHRVLEVGGDLQQIGPAEIADKQEVAGERSHRLGCAGLADQEGHMFGRVTRRMAYEELEFADLEGIAVLEELHVGIALTRPVVAPALAFAERRQVNLELDASASSRAPDRKSACMWVSTTASTVKPRSSASLR
jgi:hypothetical protein